MKRFFVLCLIVLVLTVSCAFAAEVTPSQSSDRVKSTTSDVLTSESSLPSSPSGKPLAVIGKGSPEMIVEGKFYTSSQQVISPSGISFNQFWEITVIENEKQYEGSAKVIIPYPDNLNQSSAQRAYITIEHILLNADGSVRGSVVYSNDPSINSKKEIRLLPAGVEIDVDSFSPFLVKKVRRSLNIR